MERQQPSVTGIRDGVGDGRLLALNANGSVGGTERRKWEEGVKWCTCGGIRCHIFKGRNSGPDSPGQKPGGGTFWSASSDAFGGVKM